MCQHIFKIIKLTPDSSHLTPIFNSKIRLQRYMKNFYLYLIPLHQFIFERAISNSSIRFKIFSSSVACSLAACR